MHRRCIVAVAILLTSVAFAEDDLPKHDDSDALDIEPPLLIKDGKPLAPLPQPDSPDNDPGQIEAALERAKRSAASGERLFKSGIISKVQAEDRALKVVRLESDLANARLQQAKEEYAARQHRFEAGELSKAELDAAAAAIPQAEEAARVASATREHAEIEAARANLRRQQKLLALGSGRKSDVNRAEEQLTKLTQEKE